MWGGDVVRDYLFIDDAVDAYLLLAGTNLEKLGENKIFNFGGDNVISARELVKKIIRLSKKELKIEKIGDERLSEIKFQYVSWKKANRYLGWSPKVNLNEGLKKTIEWYVKYFNL